MVTTTGNIRSSEMIGKSQTGTEGNWFSITQGVPHVVLIDEATSDPEVNIWSGIVCHQWAHAVQGVFLFGDDK
jgi:hypothetical protein